MQEITLENIDVDMLVNQKLTLLNLLDKEEEPSIIDDLEGLINLLDYIQDKIEGYE